MTNAAFYQLGPLREYLEDPTVFEIRINRFQEVICDTFSGRRVVENAAITADFIRNLAKSLVSSNKLTMQPINDVVLPGGIRGVICLPPAVIEGTTAVAFRKDLAADKNLAQLTDEGIFSDCRKITGSKQSLTEDDFLLKELHSSEKWPAFLQMAVEKKRTIVICGETGSGKTVLTRALLKALHKD
ncbi:Flp pilus assembly complex ATPase component TadA, partial [Klebsiella pneumoniae]